MISPAGWHADPDDPTRQQRYWDGVTWTDQRRPAPSGAACKICGVPGMLITKNVPLTQKRRVKFGVFWIVFTILTGGVGFLVWLVWPRKQETIGMDRSVMCRSCGAETT